MTTRVRVTAGHDHQTPPGSGCGDGGHATGQDHQPERAQQAWRCHGVPVGGRVVVVVIAEGPVVQFPVPGSWRRQRRPAAAPVQRRRVSVHGELAGRAGRHSDGRGRAGRPGNRAVHNHTEGHHQARSDGLDADVQRAAAAHGASGNERVRPGRRAACAQSERAGQAVLLGRVRRRPGRVSGNAAQPRRRLALHALRQHHPHTLGRFHG